jgi:hypothetical protein
MKKIFSNLLFIILFPFRLLKKTKFDNFIGGLIVGAVFSLIVNVVTVKTQEIINRQRVLEALEREITYHMFTANDFFSESERISKLDDKNYIYINLLINRRFSTKVWDNSEAMKYLLDLNPESSSNVEVYYDVIVSSANRMLDESQERYKKLYEPCEPYYEILTNQESKSVEHCNILSREITNELTFPAELILDKIFDVKKNFHPTHDRLNSFFLKLLMGDKSVEILKDYE